MKKRKERPDAETLKAWEGTGRHITEQYRTKKTAAEYWKNEALWIRKTAWKMRRVISPKEAANLERKALQCEARAEEARAEAERIACYFRELPEKEYSIISLTLEGKTREEIAETLFYALNTISNTRKRAFIELGGIIASSSGIQTEGEAAG